MKLRISIIVTAIVLAWAAAWAAPVKNGNNLTKGQEAYEKQQWDAAERYFNAALTEGDDYAFAAYSYLGSIKLQKEQPQEAIPLFNKAITAMNDNTDDLFKAWCYSELSYAYSETGNTQGAFDYIDFAVKMNPDDPHYLTERAVLNLKLKNRDAAWTDAKMALNKGAEGDDAERAQALLDLRDAKVKGNSTPITVIERDIEEADNAALPEFPGGMEAMRQFIKDNTVYPKKAVKKGLTGDVVVECNFDLEGNMIASQVLEGISKELDDEALRVCQAMPKFAPATLNGKPVHSRMLIKVKFNKPTNKKKKK